MSPDGVVQLPVRANVRKLSTRPQSNLMIHKTILAARTHKYSIFHPETQRYPRLGSWHQPNSTPGRKRLRQSSSQFVQQVDANEDVTFTILARQRRTRPDGPALPSLEDYSQTPFHGRKILSLDVYTNLYGASMEDLNAVVAILEGSSMTIVDQHVGVRTLTVRGSAAHIASTFGVVLNVYQSPAPMATLRRKPAGRKPSAETEIHIGYDSNISVPSKLAGIITHIVGLDTRSISAPGTASGDPGASVYRTVNNMAAIYNFPQI